MLLATTRAGAAEPEAPAESYEPAPPAPVQHLMERTTRITLKVPVAEGPFGGGDMTAFVGAAYDDRAPGRYDAGGAARQNEGAAMGPLMGVVLRY